MGVVIEGIAVAFLVMQVWLCERVTRAAAALFREATHVRQLILVRPDEALRYICHGQKPAERAWCRLRLAIHEEDGWRSICEAQDPVVHGIDRYYALEGECDFPFPFNRSHTLRLREVLRR